MTEKKHGYLTLYICLGIVAAILMAIFAPHTATKTRIGGEIFLNLLKMIVVPLVMTSVLSGILGICLLYTSPSPRDQRGSRMPSSA